MNCYTCKKLFNEDELIYWFRVRIREGDNVIDVGPMEDGPFCKECVYKRIEHLENRIKIYRQEKNNA